ncbi:MAG: acetate kinase [Legionellaceae bacterium]|nr:acetate kinase [Legionellaceae bacterium]
MYCLTINAGSSSIKYQLFHTKQSTLIERFGGLIENIGEGSGQWQHRNEQSDDSTHQFQNHEQAFQALNKRIMAELQGMTPDVVGHRIVHGGRQYRQPTIIDQQVLASIKTLARLAPLHNPANALGIECAQRAFPASQHVAVFDTAFHAHMPEKAALYPINRFVAEKEHIRRYGFHGINHAYVAQKAAEWLQKPLEQCQLISLHLGNGASACLIKDGYSQDTSMGMTPLAGLMMGTRCGDIDPAIPLYLLKQGYSPEAIDQLLNKQSGLIGISDDNDMRHLSGRAAAQDKQAQLAIDMYCYILQKTIGAYYSQCEQLDALIFTGGVGENSALIRQKTLANLAHFGLLVDTQRNTAHSKAGIRSIGGGIPAILVIRGNEELAIARECLAMAQQESGV